MLVLFLKQVFYRFFKKKTYHSIIQKALMRKMRKKKLGNG